MITTDQGQEYPVFDVHTHFAGDTAHFDPTITAIFDNLRNRQPFDQARIGRDPGALVEYLDRSGIDMVCVLAEEGPPTQYGVDSGFIIGYAAQAPSRIIPIGNLNHRIESDAGRRVRSLIRGGIRGFKQYYADHNQNPYDRALRPLYELCSEYHLPIMFHCGTHSRYYMSNAAYGRPMLFQKLFEQYPRVPFVMCHGGKGGHHEECVEILGSHPNTFIEISDITPSALREMCTEELASRFIFGTDMPQFVDYAPLVNVVLSLPISSCAKRKIFFDNAANLFGIEIQQSVSLPAAEAA
jgi:predicted TIM-barrel fold metal-dependent hydrolase